MDNNTKRSVEVLQKCEAMTLLCTRATHYWSIVKTAFQIPLILTSSIMCILNSFGTVETSMKIPNVVVNGISVILISYQSNLKVAEKVELFKQLSNSFLALAHQIEGMDIEDDAFKHVEAIIHSMTPDERTNPAVLNASRKKRIAKGSGRTIVEVNQLLKQFDQMSKMMKMMQGGGGKKMMQMMQNMK